MGKQSDSAERLELDAVRVLQEIAKVTFASMWDYLDVREDGSVLFDFHTLTKAQAGGPGELTVNEFIEASEDGKPRKSRRVSLKLGDKFRALELQSKHLKLFVGRMEHDELAETKGIFLELHKALGLDKLTV